MKSLFPKFLVLTTVIILGSVSLWAGNIEEADSAYLKGDYAQAVEYYKKVVDTDGLSSALCYDLGNAYAKGGDYGHALVNFIRALRLDPSNAQAKSNVAYVESKVYDSNRSELKGKKLSIDPDGNTFFSSVRLFICRDHLSNTWAVWAVSAFVIFVLCLALYIFSKKVIARKIGFFGGFVCLGISLITLVFAFMAAAYKSDEGVIIGGKVRLMSEASVNSKENPVALTRGTRVTILDTFPADSSSPEWYKVRLNSDFVGWVATPDFEAVGI